MISHTHTHMLTQLVTHTRIYMRVHMRMRMRAPPPPHTHTHTHKRKNNILLKLIKVLKANIRTSSNEKNITMTSHFFQCMAVSLLLGL